MGFSFKDFFVGAAVIASAFILPGSAPVWMGTLLKGVGIGLVGRAFTPEKIEQHREGVLTQSVNTTNSIPIIYGTARAAGSVVFLDTRNTSRGDNTRADLVVVFAMGNRKNAQGDPSDPNNGNIEAFGAIFADDNLMRTHDGIYGIWDLPSNATTLTIAGVSIDNEPSYQIHEHLGAHDQAADQYLLDTATLGEPWHWADPESDWTSDHRLQGLAYLVVEIKYQDKAYVAILEDLTNDITKWKSINIASVPTVSAVIKGRRVYDPRDGTWKHSDNPILCIRDYLLDDICGCALTTADLDEESFKTAANYADEVVLGLADVDTYLDIIAGLLNAGKRYTLNGVIATAQSLKQNLQGMFTTCGCILTFEQGRFKIKLRLHDLEPVDFIIDEKNVIGTATYNTADAEDHANLVIAHYVNGTKFDARQILDQVQQVQYPEQDVVNPFVVEEGVEVPREIDLPYTVRAATALQRAQEELLFMRSDLVVNVRCKEEVTQLSLYDLVQVTLPVPGLLNKQFWVVQMAFNPDSTVTLTLKEKTAGVGFEPIPAPELTTPIGDGRPYDIIALEETSNRVARVWITTPVAAVNNQYCRVVDVEDFNQTSLTSNTIQNCWSLCYVPSTNEVWIAGKDPGSTDAVIRIHDGDDMSFVDEISFSEIREPWDIEYHAGTDRVFVSGNLSSNKSVHRINPSTRAYIDGIHSSSNNDLFEVDEFSNMDIQHCSVDDIFAVSTLRDHIWYFDPNTMTEVLNVQGPIGGLIDTGFQTPQMAYDPVLNELYLAPSKYHNVYKWTPGGSIQVHTSTNRAWFNWYCDRSPRAIGTSFGTGSSLTPGHLGEVQLFFPDTSIKRVFPTTYNPARACYIPGLDMIAVLSDWSQAGQPLVGFFNVFSSEGVPPGTTAGGPTGGGGGPAPPGTPPPPPGAPQPNGGGPTGEAEPTPPTPSTPSPLPPPPGTINEPPEIITIENFEEDWVRLEPDGTYFGRVQVGWVARIRAASYAPIPSRHQLSGFATGDDPDVDTPLEVLTILSPSGPAHFYKRYIYSTDSGECPVGQYPSSSINSGTSTIRDYYIRRANPGVVSGPWSTAIHTLTHVKPGCKTP